MVGGAVGHSLVIMTDTPTIERYFEDYEPGAVHEFGSVTVSEAEIIEFAGRFDPQPIHLDLAYAKDGPFGGLIASGWHTVAMFMRLYADHYLSGPASLASPGVDEVRWPAPVRPGDTLRVRATVAEARVSRSKPDRGIVRTDVAVLNQDGTTVLTMTLINLLLRRSVRD